MILGLKTAGELTEIIIARAGKTQTVRWESGRRLSDQLLSKIKELTSRENGLKDIKGIIFFLGPGSFTSLRIGATLANTLAYSLDIPIVGTEGPDWVEQGLAEIKKAEPGGQVIPKYGQPPNITRPNRP